MTKNSFVAEVTFQHETTYETHWKGIPYTQNEITKQNSFNATLLICLYKTSTKLYMECACTALTVLNKTQRQKLKVIQNWYLWYARRAVDSACISNNELHSCCNIVSIKQHILALVDTWWKKASNNKNDIINFTLTSLNIIKGNKFLWSMCHLHYFTFFFSKTKKSKIKNIFFLSIYSIQIQYTISDSINRIPTFKLILLWLKK